MAEVSADKLVSRLASGKPVPAVVLIGSDAYLSDAIGYKYFFVWVMASTLLSFIVTWLVPFRSLSSPVGSV